jgi:hypothetical protein
MKEHLNAETRDAEDKEKLLLSVLNGTARTVAAALAGGNGAAVRTSGWVAQERADAVSHFRAEDVLEGAGVGFHRGIIANEEHVHEQALGQAVAADDAARTLFALVGKLEFFSRVLQQTDVRHGGEQPLALDLCEMRALVMHGALTLHPHLFQDLVKVFVFLRGENHGFNDTAVIEVDTTVRAPAHALVVRD